MNSILPYSLFLITVYLLTMYVSYIKIIFKYLGKFSSVLSVSIGMKFLEMNAYCQFVERFP